MCVCITYLVKHEYLVQSTYNKHYQTHTHTYHHILSNWDICSQMQSATGSAL